MLARKKFNLAHLPTPIHRLEGLVPGLDLYIKRDDYTGVLSGGNKIRKLEYVLYAAKASGCDSLITCGGLQSNHCRATVVSGLKRGLKTYLLLKGSKPDSPSANYFVDLLGQAQVRFVSDKDYAERRNELMKDWQEELAEEGTSSYIIPEGASSPLGTHGYYQAYQEIKAQEKELGLSFDSLVLACGSGGSYAGLYLASLQDPSPKDIIGVNVYSDEISMEDKVKEVLRACQKSGEYPHDLDLSRLNILSGYVGRGYALNTPQELGFLSSFFRKTGIMLDRVYGLKSFLAMQDKIGPLAGGRPRSVLFIHTGGQLANFSDSSLFNLD